MLTACRIKRCSRLWSSQAKMPTTDGWLQARVQCARLWEACHLVQVFMEHRQDTLLPPLHTQPCRLVAAVSLLGLQEAPPRRMRDTVPRLPTSTSVPLRQATARRRPPSVQRLRATRRHRPRPPRRPHRATLPRHQSGVQLLRRATLLSRQRTRQRLLALQVPRLLVCRECRPSAQHIRRLVLRTHLRVHSTLPPLPSIPPPRLNIPPRHLSTLQPHRNIPPPLPSTAPRHHNTRRLRLPTLLRRPSGRPRRPKSTATEPLLVPIVAVVGKADHQGAALPSRARGRLVVATEGDDKRIGTPTAKIAPPRGHHHHEHQKAVMSKTMQASLTIPQSCSAYFPPCPLVQSQSKCRIMLGRLKRTKHTHAHTNHQTISNSLLSFLFPLSSLFHWNRREGTPTHKNISQSKSSSCTITSGPSETRGKARESDH